MISLIVNETNLHRQLLVNWEDPQLVRDYSHSSTWTDVTPHVWLAYAMLMPHVKKDKVQDCCTYSYSNIWKKNIFVGKGT